MIAVTIFPLVFWNQTVFRLFFQNIKWKLSFFPFPSFGRKRELISTIVLPVCSSCLSPRFLKDGVQIFGVNFSLFLDSDGKGKNYVSIYIYIYSFIWKEKGIHFYGSAVYVCRRNSITLSSLAGKSLSNHVEFNLIWIVVTLFLLIYAPDGTPFDVPN